LKIKELGLGVKAEEIIAKEGITELYPPQEDAVNAGVLKGESIVLCTPTASGKTLISEMAALRALEQHKQVIYIVPLRALAAEKFKEFRKWEELGYRVDLQMGDLDSKFLPEQGSFDIIIATAEKCDSILRSRPNWFKDVGLLIMDEVHLIATSRGPVYEILIAKFKKIFPEVQILALSATIGNAQELSNWLGATLVKSDWRPVTLEQSVKAGKSNLMSEVKASVKEGNQSLVFVNSRASAESVAEKIGHELPPLLSDDEKNDLDELSEDILKALSPATVQCKRLAAAVKGGAAFHHAGLVNKQRELVENGFKKGLIKSISATPTLAAGINMPARKVIIRDIKRFTGGGSEYIPVLEYMQMVGRAGRPRYDTKGESVLLASTVAEASFLEDNYLNGEPEQIHSQLGVEPVLRMHVLAAVASGFTRDKSAVLDFFGSSFFAHQYGLDEAFSRKVNKIIKQLDDWGFLMQKGSRLSTRDSGDESSDSLFVSATKILKEEKENPRLIATPLGSRVSEMYLDPEDAYKFIKTIENPENIDKINQFGLIHLITGSHEMRPLLRVKQKEEDEIWGLYYELEEKLMKGEGDSDYLNQFKTALMLQDWVNEKSEDFVLENYGMAPGLLRIKLDTAEWLSYAWSEMMPYLKVNSPSLNQEIQNVKIRIKHGVKEELLPLVAVRGIGRVRARKLFNAEIKTPNQLRKTDMKLLGELLGQKIAEAVKSELR
jgi:helicase